MEIFEITSKHHGHVFMVNDEFCDKCDFVTTHFYALVATNKAMNNAKRVKTCDDCKVTSLAPVKE